MYSPNKVILYHDGLGVAVAELEFGYVSSLPLISIPAERAVRESAVSHGEHRRYASRYHDELSLSATV